MLCFSQVSVGDFLVSLHIPALMSIRSHLLSTAGTEMTESVLSFFFLTCTFHFIKVAFFRAFNCILRFSFVALLSFTDQTSFICISGNYVNKKTIENNNARKWITFPNFPT